MWKQCLSLEVMLHTLGTACFSVKSPLVELLVSRL